MTHAHIYTHKESHKLTNTHTHTHSTQYKQSVRDLTCVNWLSVHGSFYPHPSSRCWLIAESFALFANYRERPECQLPMHFGSERDLPSFSHLFIYCIHNRKGSIDSSSSSSSSSSRRSGRKEKGKEKENPTREAGTASLIEFVLGHLI